MRGEVRGQGAGRGHRVAPGDDHAPILQGQRRAVLVFCRATAHTDALHSPPQPDALPSPPHHRLPSTPPSLPHPKCLPSHPLPSLLQLQLKVQLFTAVSPPRWHKPLKYHLCHPHSLTLVFTGCYPTLPPDWHPEVIHPVPPPVPCSPNHLTASQSAPPVFPPCPPATPPSSPLATLA